MYDVSIPIERSTQSVRAREEDRDRKLRKACEDFEAVFAYELLKSMRRTVEKCDLFHGGQGEEIYESLLDQEMSKSMAGLSPNSLAGVLYRQLKGRESGETPGGADVTARIDAGADGPRWPLRARLSSGFGWRKDPIDGDMRFHYGIDLAAEKGTLVRAALPGKVVASEIRGGYGRVVELDHGGGFRTLYAHNEENLVREGDWINQGAPLARVGSSGRSTGPHLHFEVLRHGRHLDPKAFLEGTQT